MLLAVFLGADRIGEIAVGRDENVEFRFLDSYIGRDPRPVLGQIFEDDLHKVHRTRIKLPAFFSNLLPEGALRSLIAGHLGIRADREPRLLAHLGDDLPGAVRVRMEEEGDDDENAADHEDETHPDALKFSLAGVQLKLSALRGDRGLTIPTHGRGGEWIVKLPDPRFPGVPENEWSMMTLAKLVGIDVPRVDLIPVAEIQGLPAGLNVALHAKALAVRRFDRPGDGQRVHMEDFAQVLNVRPSPREKYGTNFETIARILAHVSPRSAEQFVRRLVFNIAIGNGDAHLKNWSLLYPDGVRPELSPAYDLVSTVQYLPDDDLGLNLARSKRFADVRMESFERLRDKSGLPVDDVRSVVLSMVRAVREAWTTTRNDLPITAEEKSRLEQHFARVPLLS
jgi:serine/threonine-protein kinase HipA